MVREAGCDETEEAHMATFDGKTAVITGASSGIGRATAELLAAQGANVVIGDVAVEGAKETVDRITEAGGQATFQETDVTDSHAADALVRLAVDTYGSLDCAVNNAGTEGELLPTVDMSDDSWHRTLSINLTGVFFCLRAELRQMRAQGHGSVVNIASILGLVGYGSTPAYTASKHGVIGLTKVAALDHAAEGIRVNAVCPGWIETPMVMERGVKAGENEQTYEELKAAHPLGRLGQPEEIAETIAWLCSDKSSFVTGQPFAADGGYTAQ